MEFDTDIILDEIDRLRDKQIKLECNDTEKFQALIIDVSILYTRIAVRLNKFSKNDLYNLRFNSFMSPKSDNIFEYLLWLSLHYTDYSSRSLDLEGKISESESSTGNYTSEFLNSAVRSLESIITEISIDYPEYFKLFHSSIVSLRSSIRASVSPYYFLRTLLTSNLCNVNI